MIYFIIQYSYTYKLKSKEVYIKTLKIFKIMSSIKLIKSQLYL